MRCFLALSLPDDVTARLARVQDDLPRGRAVDEGDLHLTLAFLDDVPDAVLDDLHLDLDAARLPGAHVRLSGLGTFGADPPRSLHVHADPDPGLITLEAKVAGLARRARIPLRHRRFVPHVTLARFRRGTIPDADADARLAQFLTYHGALACAPFVPHALHLIGAHLTPDGPNYDILSSYPLAKPGPAR